MSYPVRGWRGIDPSSCSYWRFENKLKERLKEFKRIKVNFCKDYNNKIRFDFKSLSNKYPIFEATDSYIRTNEVRTRIQDELDQLQFIGDDDIERIIENREIHNNLYGGTSVYSHSYNLTQESRRFEDEYTLNIGQRD